MDPEGGIEAPLLSSGSSFFQDPAHEDGDGDEEARRRRRRFLLAGRSQSNTTSQVALVGVGVCPIESLDYEYGAPLTFPFPIRGARFARSVFHLRFDSMENAVFVGVLQVDRERSVQAGLEGAGAGSHPALRGAQVGPLLPRRRPLRRRRIRRQPRRRERRRRQVRRHLQSHARRQVSSGCRVVSTSEFRLGWIQFE